jgi:GR25 family glycosyltransferase involved in LPS biosynthesis
VTTAPPGIANTDATESRLARHWDSFDRVYCISLTNRPDRCETALAQFRRVGLGDRVKFIFVDKHPTNSEEGIFESHMACLRAGLAAGAERILVFEDDIIFSRFSPERLGLAVQFMELKDDWRLFFFGCFVNSSRKTRFQSVVKIDYRCCAHGYVVNREFAKKLVQLPWQNIPYDDLLRSLGPEGVYAIYPAFAFQSDASSDNDKIRGVYRVRRMMGGLYWLQQWNEFSTRRFVPLVLVHVVALFILAMFLRIHHGALWR